MSETKSDDLRVMELAVKQLTDHFNEFIGSCMDANGKPIAPPMKALMQARACLPARCEHAFQPKEKKK
jgi:hypothetical protein